MALKAGRVGVNPSQVDELGNIIGKQDTLTFDTAPTENSTNPVTSGGVYTAIGGKQNTLTFDTEPTEASTNPVTSGGVYTALLDKLSYEDNSILGAKNLFPLELAVIKAANTDGTWSGNEYTKSSGVVFIVNTDNDDNIISIGVNNASSTSEFTDFNLAAPNRVTLDNFGLVVGQTYTFTNGLVQDSSDALLIFNGLTGNILSSVDGTQFTVDNTSVYYPQIRIYNRTTVTDLTFHPMIRLATDTDATFRPYAMTNLELTAAIRALQNNI